MRDSKSSVSPRLIVCVTALLGCGSALSQGQQPETVCEGAAVERAGEDSGACRDRSRHVGKSASGDSSVAGYAEIGVTGDGRSTENGGGAPRTSAGEEAGVTHRAVEGAGDAADAVRKVLETVGECVGRRFKKCR